MSKIVKMPIGTNNLKKYLFLFIKGHLGNGLTFGEIDDMLVEVVHGVFDVFLKKKYEVSKEDYPYLFDKNGEQIGCKVEDYKDET
jgi:hypothetical protein